MQQRVQSAALILLRMRISFVDDEAEVGCDEEDSEETMVRLSDSSSMSSMGMIIRGLLVWGGIL